MTGDHSEDGECSGDSDRHVIEVLDNGSFVLDCNAEDDGDLALHTSHQETKYEQADNEQQEENSRKRKDWLKSAMSNLMTMKDGQETTSTPKKDKRRKLQCFNCNGEHNMTSCTEPKNYKRIRENREAYNAAKTNDTRYMETSSASSSCDFKPGRLSANLQRALGIGPNDIPEYIYRMRKMGFVGGYPPGYLKRAIVRPTNSDDLLVFHSDNPEFKDEKEEGETEEPPSSPTVNSEKIIYYFGFNQTYRALRDREDFRVPPFEEFVKFLERKVKEDFREEIKREERKKKTAPLQSLIDEKRTKTEAADDEDLILEAPPPPPLIQLDDVKEEEDELKPAPSTPTSTPTARGRIALGTPVLQRKNLGEGMKTVPSLEAFAKGIVPFQVDEPTPRTGFMQKIMQTIKKNLG